PGTSFSADIVDALEQSYASFKASAPDAVREYNLDFKQCDVRSGEFWEWLDAEMEKHGPWNRVVVAMQDDSVNFRLATEMSRRYLERGVKLRVDEVFFVRVRSDETEMRIHSMRKLGLMPSSFGCLSSIYTKATVVDEQQDRAAEYRNWLYRHTPTDQFSHADWLNTSMFDKESSRASAFGIRTILRLAGFCWNADARAFEPIPGNSRSLVAALESPKLKENLAESEHNRWMAFLLMRGIKRWNLNDPTQENVEELAKSGYVKANRQKQMRRHAALVPYGKILQEVADAIDAANKKAANRLDKDGNPEPSRIATDDAKTVSEILKVIAAAGWVVDDGATTTKDTP
ncbi:MAG: hypothetical protein IKZ46_08315, partial [Victivallales bacterium]|nr:hypothetical protein [Victivallales bacterium]